jgi:nitrite reductase/ring-hydroxylating ferredoxin subunit
MKKKTIDLGVKSSDAAIQLKQKPLRYLAQIDNGSHVEEFLIISISATEHYCIDAICPHSGGPLYQGVIDIEDLQNPRSFLSTATTTTSPNSKSTGNNEAPTKPSASSDPLIVCPWHAFRYSLRTGVSEDSVEEGHNAKVLPVVVVDGKLAIEVPECFELVSIRPWEAGTSR